MNKAYLIIDGHELRQPSELPGQEMDWVTAFAEMETDLDQAEIERIIEERGVLRLRGTSDRVTVIERTQAGTIWAWSSDGRTRHLTLDDITRP